MAEKTLIYLFTYTARNPVNKDMDNTQKRQPANFSARKRIYHTPIVKQLGKLSTLTTSGSINKNENRGHPNGRR